MTTYALADGMTLVVKVDRGKPQVVTFSAADFARIEAATPAEVAAVLATAGLGASVDANGRLIIESPTQGMESSVTVDVAKSTAATALGVSKDTVGAAGTGPRAAAVTSSIGGPFPIPVKAEMTVTIDGDRKPVVFDDITDGRATADEIVKAINTTFKMRVAQKTGGRVRIISPTAGPQSTVAVGPARKAAFDAAAAMGFSGATAADTGESAPGGGPATPAQLVVPGATLALHAHNVSGTPIQFVMVTRSIVVPAGGTVELTPAEAAHRPLQRLIENGAVRLSWSLTA